ncbi:DMT family transporter [Erwinia sp. 198]|nr:DMT family transporter [Erwinia sp. 198]
MLAFPVALPIAALTLPASFHTVTFSAWMGLGYVSLFSMLTGFIFWYHGLAKGGTEAVGQLQLLQPFIGFGFAALFLHESISNVMLACVLAALGCVAGAKKFA